MHRIIVVLALVLSLGAGLGLAAPGGAVKAQDATPAVGAGGAFATLVSVELGRDQVPGEVGFVYLGRVIHEPGSQETCACPTEIGTVVEYVEYGTLTIKLENEARIIRGANTSNPVEEPAAAGTQFELSAGDAVVFPGKHRVAKNEGTETASFLFALILDPSAAPPEPDPTNVGVFTLETLGVVVGPWPDLGDDLVTITLSASTLGPGAELPSPASGLQVVVPDAVQDAAQPPALIAGDGGSTLNSGAVPLGVIVLSIVPAASEATPTA